MLIVPHPFGWGQTGNVHGDIMAWFIPDSSSLVDNTTERRRDSMILSGTSTSPVGCRLFHSIRFHAPNCAIGKRGTGISNHLGALSVLLSNRL
jgi:hypothetical protein